MVPTPSPHAARVQRLLDQHNLAALVDLLRQPADSELRAQAAWALGELRQMEAVESLARSILEDPEPGVSAAARRALQALLGSDADLVVASYRHDRPSDAWLMEPLAEPFPAEGNFEISEDDLSGLILVARHESNPDLRLKAVRLLARSSDIRATDILAELALWGDSAWLRSAARQALESLYGENSGSILDSYRDASGSEDEDDFLEDEESSQDEPEDLEEGQDEEEWDEDAEDEEEDEAGGRGEIFPAGQKNPLPSPYPSTLAPQPGRPVVEDMGIPWRTVAGILLIVLLLAALFFILRP